MPGPQQEMRSILERLDIVEARLGELLAKDDNEEIELPDEMVEPEEE